MAALLDSCTLHHSVFSLPGACFRKAADGTAVMAVPFGDSVACVTLRSLQREFSIDPGSEDGLMLSLVAEALDFVGSMRVGDQLPAEVLGQGASWTAAARYRDAAAARLQRCLLAWLAGMSGRDANGAAGGMEADGALRTELQAALSAASATLGLSGTDEVLTLIGSLADELSFIEALRDTLLRRVRMMLRKVNHLGTRRTRDAVHAETLTQVQRLSDAAHRQLAARFTELDDRTAAILHMLQSVERERAFIRSSRDWLYRTSRAWSPVLDEWARSGLVLDEFAWGLLSRTYQFLAPRYMPVTEWQAAGRRLALRSTAVPWER